MYLEDGNGHLHLFVTNGYPGVSNISYLFSLLFIKSPKYFSLVLIVLYFWIPFCSPFDPIVPFWTIISLIRSYCSYCSPYFCLMTHFYLLSNPLSPIIPFVTHAMLLPAHSYPMTHNYDSPLSLFSLPFPCLSILAQPCSCDWISPAVSTQHRTQPLIL